MPHAEPKGDGWRGVYRDSEGRRHKTEKFRSKKKAEQAAAAQEARVRAGTWFDPAAGRVTLTDYVEGQWMRNRGGELNTQAGYSTHWKAVKKRFGDVELRRILPSSVQGWVADMLEDGVGPSTVRARVIFLQTVLAAKKGASAMRDGLIDRNPCHGTVLPVVPEREVAIYEPDQIYALLEAADPYWSTLLLLCSETGLRWGELMGLRVCDFELDFRALTARRTIVQSTKEKTGNGTPFAWKEYPKGKRPRRLALSPDSRAAVGEWVAACNLGMDDRLFSMPSHLPRERRIKVLLTDDLLASLGDFTAPNGRRYSHGTINGYTVGKCRCGPCKQASTDYRFKRLHGETKPPAIEPTPRRTAEWLEGLPIDKTWFREAVWLPTIGRAGLPVRRFHDLRASHISFLLSEGIDMPTVMERAGHREYDTTRRYTKTLSDADEKVLEALARRRRTS